MIVIPFKREHMENMTIQEKQKGLEDLMTDDIYTLLEECDSYTFIDGDEVIACAGTIEITPGRAIAWAHISGNIGPKRMVGLTWRVRRFLDMKSYRRVEMDVDCDFEQAHKWARMLGFEMECERRRKYSPDGRDCALYARVR